MKHSPNKSSGAFANSIVFSIAVIAAHAFCSGPAQAAVPGITGGVGAPLFSLVASAGNSSQPDGALVYSWGYGCGNAGATVGAMFIKEFTGDTPWIHLDIAGTAWQDDVKPWAAKGATGVPNFPIRLGRAMSWLRSGTPRFSHIRARAWELISAIFTP